MTLIPPRFSDAYSNLSYLEKVRWFWSRKKQYMNKYCDTKSWIGELVSLCHEQYIECEFSKILILSKTDFCNGNLIEFGVFFCKQKLHNALFRLDYSFQVCLQSNKFSAAGKRWTSKLKILLWQMPNLMKHTIIQIISESSFKFLLNVCIFGVIS